MGYGVGKITEEIQHNGDTLAVKTTMPTGVNENKLRIDGTEQDATDPDGTLVRTTLKWEGADIVSSTKNPKTGKFVASTRRTMQGKGAMSTQITGPSGIVVRRFFSPCT